MKSNGIFEAKFLSIKYFWWSTVFGIVIMLLSNGLYFGKYLIVFIQLPLCDYNPSALRTSLALAEN